MDAATLPQVARIFQPPLFITAFPHVLPHIKYSEVLPLKISIINKQNSCFCFEMEHHAGLERKHQDKFVIVNLKKNAGIFHLQEANIISYNIQTLKQPEACKPASPLHRPWLLLLIPPSFTPGSVPSSLKSAAVMPILTKTWLRNLPFLSRILKKIDESQVTYANNIVCFLYTP